MKAQTKKALKILGVSLGVLLLVWVTVFAVRGVLTLRDPAKLAAFQEYITSLGFAGWLLLLAIQYLQIVIAVIPGGPIQIVAGALFGPIGGLLTCLLGIVLATFTVFSLVSRYGHKIIRLFVKEKEIKDYKFLRGEKRLERLVVILFLIPGTPKDVLTYLFALTPIPIGRFLLLSSVARVPAALTSVLAGNSIAQGDWLQALIYFVIISAVSLGGLVAHRRVMDFYHKKRR